MGWVNQQDRKQSLIHQDATRGGKGKVINICQMEAKHRKHCSWAKSRERSRNDGKRANDIGVTALQMR